MTLEVDALVDRRRLKRQVLLWRVLAVVLAVAAAVIAVGRIAGGTGDYVARLTVSGLITEDRKRDRLLADAADNDRIKALIVFIDSPGGTVVGAEQLYTRLRQVAAKKPVVATMGPLATSAGYYIALGGERIYAYEGTITASIGVIFQATDLTVLLERIGVKVDAIKSAPLKAAPNPFEKTTPEARAVIDALVKDSFDQFLGKVRERRRLDEDKLRIVSDGRVVTGRQALALGLVDALGGEDQAIDWLEAQKKIRADLPVRTIDAKPGVEWGDLFDLAFGGRGNIARGLALDGLISLWHPALR